MNFKKIMAALQAIEKDRMLTKEIVTSALEEALTKAFRKQISRPEAQVRVDFNDKSGEIKIYHQKPVVEEVLDEELELDVYDVEELGLSANVGEVLEFEVNIDEFSRAAVILAKNVMKQKIREAEKLAIYEEYIDYVGDMVSGVIESIEPKFLIVNLGKTMALMSKSNQNPLEKYYEGQRINVIITEVLKETKGAQVLVSRTDTTLVKRLFEKEVPEIYDGIIEIKAIARDAGERTKMAVVSHDPNIEAIGSCIGPKRKRVQAVIDELLGEKIDIFEWKDDIKQLIENALAPAPVIGVVENGRELIVIVEDDQLSLAIGKKGKNARLAVKLVGRKVDIKSVSDAERLGIKYNEAITLAEEKQIVEDKQTTVIVEEAQIKETKITIAEEVEEREQPEVEKVEVVEEKQPVKPVDISDVLRQVQKAKKEVSKKSAPKPKEKEERKIRIPSVSAVSKNTASIYSEEELEEIEKQQELEEQNSWIYDDTDFDEFEEYYDDYE